ncbi:MAG TPA: outer membrane beta-barrel protein [Anaeromyxobacteraceae bacterium]|nr:outer membrane beta-barrel protein [Anaeromyxobacteraceae bacterium]
MRPAGPIAALAALLLAPLARAGEDGITAGVRAGLGFAFGKVDGRTASSISDSVPGDFPLWLELGYRFDRHWSLVGFFQYGPATTDACPGVDCRASDQRLGVTAVYRFDPSLFTPWMGLGAGYEWLYVELGAPVRAGGLELSLQAGGDFQVGSGIGLGPYLCFSVGQFSDVTAGGSPQSLTDKTTHGWVQVGVKGTFDF